MKTTVLNLAITIIIFNLVSCMPEAKIKTEVRCGESETLVDYKCVADATDHEQQGAPVLFFSDLDSGPSIGNGDTSLGQATGANGVIVTIWGKRLGYNNGISKIYIGNQEVDYIYYWGNVLSLEKSGGEFNKSLYDSHHMQKISFQIPSIANDEGIYIIVDGKRSNILQFKIRSGAIYFVDDNSPNNPGTGTYSDPWRSPASYINALTNQDGATCYFRGGIYSNTEYALSKDQYKSLFYVGPSVAGSENNSNAFVGYPNEIASFEATAGNDKRDPNYYMSVINDYPYNSATYLTIANLRLETNTIVANIRSNWRFIGNLCIGGNVFNNGTGILITGSHIKHATMPEVYVKDHKIYGNVITGERTANKLNHAVYFGASKDNDFGWNYIYNNNVMAGPILSCNSEDSKENGYLPMENQLIHDNVIDMSHYPSRAIGVHELSEGSSLVVYNNIIIGPTKNNQTAIYARSASVTLYNNTLYNVGSSDTTAAIIAFQKRDPGTGVIYYPENIIIKNNIVNASNDALYYLDIPLDLRGLTSQIVIDTNSWYGIGAYVLKSKGLAVNLGTGHIESPVEFVNILDFHLVDTSPLLNLGTTSVSDIVKHDFDGFNTSSSIFHIGVYGKE